MKNKSIATNDEPVPNSLLRYWGVTLLVCLASAFYLFWNLSREPFFPDESADIAQSYYYRLAVAGDIHHPDWLHIAAVDHLPTFKYLIGAGLAWTGREPPKSLANWERWMFGDHSPPSDPGVLLRARIPMTVGAVFGCVIVFLFVRNLSGVCAGLMAVVLLLASPLYTTLGRRAMSDDLTQALAFLSVALVYRMGANKQRQRLPGVVFDALIAGAFAGLAASVKLNGLGSAVTVLVGLTLALICGWFLGRLGVRETLAASGVGGWYLVAAGATFVAVNPYFYAKPNLAGFQPTANPRVVQFQGANYTQDSVVEMGRILQLSFIQRFANLLRHREESLASAAHVFPKMAIPSGAPRLRKIAREGLGRWFAGGAGYANLDTQSPLQQFADWYWTVPTLLCILGVYVALCEGWEQARDGWPVDWLLVVGPALEVASLMRNLTVDFDRYYLGVVVWGSVLIPYGLFRGAERIRRAMVLRAKREEGA